VQLSAQPNAPVYVTVSAAGPGSENPGADTVLVSTDGVNFVRALVLTFDGGNFATPQIIYVSAAADSVAEGEATTVVSHSTSSADPNFNAARVENRAVTVLDDDKPGLLIQETNGGTLVLEGDATTRITDSYTVALTRQPAPGTTVTVTLGQDGQLVLVDGSNAPLNALVFDSTNWNVPQTVNVRALDDGVRENRGRSTIAHTITSDDPAFSSAEAGEVRVAVVDNDSAGLLITESDGTTRLIKNGAGDSYTVRLTQQPTGPVTVTLLGDGQAIASSADGRFNATNHTVTFDATNWWQPVTINLVADANFVPQAGSDFVKNFPGQSHTLVDIRGPLLIEGGVGTTDRSLVTAVKLPSELDAPLPGVDVVTDELQQRDTLNVFNDGSSADDTGTLTATRIHGLGMGGALTVDEGTPGDPKLVTYNGGITYGAVEVVKVLLGSGDDIFNVENTLSTTAAHGGITAVHGGGGSDTITITGVASPLVVYGDTSQDGSAYASAAPSSPLGRPFINPGNDHIFAQASTGGVTIYGGEGNDEIVGSQFGDQLAGGSGDDTIIGNGGNDHIYGDSGFNVNLVTRELTVPYENTSLAPNADELVPGNDHLEGGAGNDILLGDHGVITLALGTQRLLTTGNVASVSTVRPGDGGTDVILGGLGDDVILGGFGGDQLSGNEDRDVILGDNGFVDFGENDADLTTLDIVRSTDPLLGGADTISGGSGEDIVFGGTAGDSIFGDEGSDVLLGDHGLWDSLRPANQHFVSILTGAGDGAGDDSISGGSGTTSSSASKATTRSSVTPARTTSRAGTTCSSVSTATTRWTAATTRM
jgi:Ca2+-binding RTX toxin-like protein